MVKVLDIYHDYSFHARCEGCGKMLEFGFDDLEVNFCSENTFFVQCPNCGTMVHVTDNVM